MTVAYRDLVAAAETAFHDEGLERPHAKIVAETLVEADLMGHSTHGLALLPRYLDELRNGLMTTSGTPRTISDTGVAAVWDGGYLPGPVLVRQALDLGAERAAETGVATVAISRSHHIACLAAYLPAMTDRGLAAIIATSAPSTTSVAPFGSCEGVYSPNPIAAGWPTEGAPIIIDISTSITTNNLTAAHVASGAPLPESGWSMKTGAQAMIRPF